MGSPSAMFLDMLEWHPSLDTERSTPSAKAVRGKCLSDKPADSAALWNMALRVEADMVFPTGGAVVSRSVVVLSGVIHGNM